MEDVTLKEYLIQLIANNDKRYEQRFNDTKIAVDAALIAADKAVTAALAGQKEAVTKAEVAAEKRFESVNEFRSTLANQQRSLMPRQEYEANHKALADRIDKIESKELVVEGKGGGIKEGWGWAVAVIMFIIALVGFVSNFLK